MEILKEIHSGSMETHMEFPKRILHGRISRRNLKDSLTGFRKGFPEGFSSDSSRILIEDSLKDFFQSFHRGFPEGFA